MLKPRVVYRRGRRTPTERTAAATATAESKLRLQTMLPLTSSVLAILFVITYGCLRPANESFYSQLGLRPEDVGITETALIGSAGARVGIIVLLIISVIAGLVLGWRSGSWINKTLSNWIDPRLNKLAKTLDGRIPFWVTALVMLGMLIATVWSAYVLALRVSALTPSFVDAFKQGYSEAQTTRLGWSRVFKAYLTIEGVFAFAALLTAFLGSGWRLAAWLPRFLRRFVPVIALILATGIVTAVVTLWARSAEFGEQLMNGEPLTAARTVAPWIQIQLVPARVTSRSDPLSLCSSNLRPFALGGISDNTYLLLYRPAEKSALIRVSSSDYSVAYTDEANFECGKEVKSLPR